MEKNLVSMNKNGIYIRGKSEIIMCSSLFYFRIPKGMWRDRLRKVKTAGYNCIDVYFPWNYHETSEGKWEFSEEKDVAEYLKMAAEEKLLIIARPGPYICSEWDCGGLPGYLLSKKSIKLRDNNEVYLKYVDEWFRRIIPILSEYQLGKKGTIIAVQVENELDFYNCEDVQGYIEKLRDMAKNYGITVPITVCAGQGEVANAGGTVEGVIPTLNFYPDIHDGSFEGKVKNYYESLKELQFPLLVTETHRCHSLLKRELCSGAKFLGPYNQVGGFDFGYTTSVNNWGQPLGYMTHHYGFGSMIGPYGELTEEFFEARLMNDFISSFGEVLAEAEAVSNHNFKISSDVALGNFGASVLRLKNDGFVVGIANVDTKDGSAVITYDDKQVIPQKTIFNINEGECRLISVNVPLSIWGLQGTIVYSTAEFSRVMKFGTTTVMILNAEEEGEIAFKLSSSYIKCEGAVLEKNGEEKVIIFNAKERGKCNVDFPNGSKLIIRFLPRTEAACIIEVKENGDVIVGKKDFLKECESFKISPVNLKKKNIENFNRKFDADKILLDGKADFMESNGLYRGYGFYNSKALLYGTQKVLGYVLHNAADILSLYVNDKFLGTKLSGGTCVFIKEDEEVQDKELNIIVRSEIWGHSNFSDSRLPAMSIHSLKGLSGITVVTNIKNISTGWRYYKGIHCSYCINEDKAEDKLRPILAFAGFNNPEQPQAGYYKKTIKASPETNSCVLFMDNLNSIAKVYVDGKFVKELNKYDFSVVLDDYLDCTAYHDVVIYYEARFIEESKDINIRIFEGVKPLSWILSGAEERKLWENAVSVIKGANTIQLPLILKPGEAAWLGAEKNILQKNYSYEFRCKGQNGKATVFLNGKMIGRLWLNNDKEVMPILKGGNPDSLYLPQCWLKESNDIYVMVEALAAGREAVISEIEFKSMKTEWILE
ncbi:beta-galactosidase [Clostridium oryzae]|uniref:Beta-galactosidase n=1 Tax=Clostridium oryzae TaxID=1450648 RepID=A0A1V4IYX5_9CLOT|nr:beta-galactosidase [Clostridium oryzae]OPJ65268.1 beta-galactosidase precursor [Clostridium oryzae]